MNIQVALYARVSSERQVQANTIESQLEAIQARIASDGYTLLKEFQFIDDGYSGSTLMRPALEHLRDIAANNLLDKLYVYSPDRLARKYAYQYLLIEEFSKLGIDVVFLNNQMENNPESNLLLQVQGMISEYERTKIMERSRRGKLHAAKQGSVNVLSNAPYGYEYIKKSDDAKGCYEINKEKAEVVRLIFSWIAHERISINAATNRLTKKGIPTPTEKSTRWNRGTVYCMLKNPAYKGVAAFGKTKTVPKKLRLRPNRGQNIHSKHPCSLESVPKNEWILIPVPSIVDEDLFEIVQEQLEENRKRKRERMKGVCFLLRGLVVCNKCQYGYCGNNPIQSPNRGYGYYVCGGTRVYANRDRMCDNKSIRSDLLEKLVWEEVKNLLENPFYLEKEYHRRIKELETSSNKQDHNKLKAGELKLKKSIARLIDSYTEGIIEKVEFEPRIKKLKIRLSFINQQISQYTDKNALQLELKFVIGRIEEFATSVKEKLKTVSWQTKRDIIKALVKRIEIGIEEVNIVFRVDPFTLTTTKGKSFLEDRCRSVYI